MHDFVFKSIIYSNFFQEIPKLTILNFRPQGGGAHCEGPERKFEACNAEQCINVPKLTVREFADQICKRAKEVEDELTGIGLQKMSSSCKLKIIQSNNLNIFMIIHETLSVNIIFFIADEACLVWCQKQDGSVKSRGWHFPDGTVCQTRRSRHGRANFCISGRCEEFVCDSFDESPFVQMSDLCPVERQGYL